MRLVPAVIALVLAPARGSAQTFFQYVSEPHDYVGGGQSALLLPADGTFTASTAFSGTVQVNFQGTQPGNFWSLQFNNGLGTPLTPGTYHFAQRWPFNPAGVPGLSVFGNGNGCNTLTGRFVVSEVVLSGAQVVRFAADFEQHCEGLGPALIGAIRFNSSAPTLLARLLNASNTPESYSFVSQPGSIGNGQSGSVTNLTNGPFSVFTNAATGGLRVWLPWGPGSWDLMFESGTAGLLPVGSYPDAQDAFSNPPGVPGINVSGYGSTCTALGSFTVSEAQYNGGGGVRRFALDFQHHCGAASATLVGSLRLNSLVPPALYEMLGLSFASTFCGGTGCPCGNDDELGGCAGASGQGAALTVGAGGPSLAADDLELVALGLPPHGPALLLAGRSLEERAFGNGRLCLAGHVARLAVAQADAQGGARWSHVGAAAGALAAWSGPGPASAVRFQAWYRDAGGSCGASANLTNGLQVSFQP
jgi:hypothetical protein